MSMTRKQTKDAILWDLRNGVIQPFQIETRLEMKGVASYEIEGLKNEILEAYENDQPRY